MRAWDTKRERNQGGTAGSFGKLSLQRNLALVRNHGILNESEVFCWRGRFSGWRGWREEGKQ